MIGVDFGGTNIKFGDVVGSDIVRSLTLATPAEATPSTVLDTIAHGVRVLDVSPTTVGLAIPGEVDGEGRCFRLPNVPGFEGLNIARELGARTGAKVFVENDGTTAALAEALFGHGTHFQSFVIVTLGTGIGGGVVLERRLHRGKYGFGGEIGHVLVDSSPEAWPCACGRRGCVEAYAGTAGLLRKYREMGGQAALVGEVAAAARTGDERALAVFEMMARALASALTTIQNVLDLDAFVFTGGISRSFDLVEPTLRTRLRELAYAPPLAEVALLVSELGDKAGVVGAAHLVQALQRAEG